MDERVRQVGPATTSGKLTPAAWLQERGLTPREIEVALLVGQGLTVGRIAQRLTIALGTVKALLAGARTKLRCRNARGLALILLREGLVQPGDLLDPREGNEEDAQATESTHER